MNLHQRVSKSTKLREVFVPTHVFVVVFVVGERIAAWVCECVRTCVFVDVCVCE